MLARLQDIYIANKYEENMLNTPYRFLLCLNYPSLHCSIGGLALIGLTPGPVSTNTLAHRNTHLHSLHQHNYTEEILPA